MVAKERERKATPVRGYPIGESGKSAFLLPLQSNERALLLVPEGVVVSSLAEGEQWPSKQDGVYRVGKGNFAVVDLETGEQTIIVFGENSNSLRDAA